MEKSVKFLKTNEAAKYLGVSRSSLANWIRQGLISGGTTPGGHYRFTSEELDRFAIERGLNIPGTSSAADVSRILLIEDDPDFREYVVEALEVFSGFELKEAADGVKGALLVGSWEPDLIILDIRMPNMNGLEFCKLLRENYGDDGIKVIVASAHLSPDVKTDLERLGVDLILEKPVRLEKLVAAIQQLVRLKLKE